MRHLQLAWDPVDPRQATKAGNQHFSLGFLSEALVGYLQTREMESLNKLVQPEGWTPKKATNYENGFLLKP